MNDSDIQNLERQFQPLTQVNEILAHLQGSKWSDHSPDVLVSAQGKLSSLMGNVGSLGANALYEYELKEHHAKLEEAERYVLHRSEKQTEGECRAKSRLDTKEAWEATIEAKHAHKSLQSVLEAMKSMITACQVTLKEQRADRGYSNFQNL